jgi:hypothetical protein
LEEDRLLPKAVMVCRVCSLRARIPRGRCSRWWPPFRIRGHWDHAGH